MVCRKTRAFAPNFCSSTTTVGPARKPDFQELVFPSIYIGMQSLNVSLAPSLDMCSERVCFLDVEQNTARNTKGHLQKEEKTTVLHPGEDTGDRKP